MTTIHQTRLGSILLSTACLVAFAMLQGPVINPFSEKQEGIQFREPVVPGTLAARLLVPAGKSVIVDSPSNIVRASVSNPELARAVSIDAHELLLNGTTPGRTSITLWEEDGSQKQFEVNIEGEPSGKISRKMNATEKPAYHGLAASYEDAMDRVQTAITGVAR
jgi:Flp pilus assembly secretin CpaC